MKPNCSGIFTNVNVLEDGKKQANQIMRSQEMQAHSTYTYTHYTYACNSLSNEKIPSPRGCSVLD